MGVLHPILLWQLLPSQLTRPGPAWSILAADCWIIGINWLLPTLARNLPECPDYQPQFGASSSFIILWQRFPGTGKGELN